MAQDKDDEKEKGGDAKGGGKPQLTPEQEAEAAAKKAARAEAKAKGGKGPGKGKGGAARERGRHRRRVKRDAPPRLRKLYDAEIRAKLMKEFSLTNPMQVPQLIKITVNMGLGEAVTNPKMLDSAVEELARDHRPAPVVTTRQEVIAVFKLREGQKIGAMVTLRRERMWEFLDRLVNFALPRVRDFKGVSPKAFDGRGNFTMGVREADHLPRDRATTSSTSQGHEHHHRHHAPRTTSRGARCCDTSGCRSGTNHGKDRRYARQQKRRSGTCVTATAASSAAVRGRSCASSSCAASASACSRCAATSRASSSRAGNRCMHVDDRSQSLISSPASATASWRARPRCSRRPRS